MATDVVPADLAETAPPVDRPYAPSWLNVLIDLIEQAPGSPAAVYVALTLISVIGSNLQAWLAGIDPVGVPSVQGTGWGIVTVGVLAVVHLFDGMARVAFDTVRPLMSATPAEADRLRYELTTIPARPAWLILIVSVPFTILPYVTDPVASGVVGYPPAAIAIRTIAEGFVSAVLLMLLYQAVRQLRLVGRILDRVERIDLFHQRPLYAFSRLTGGIGIALIAIVLIGLALAPSPSEATSFWYVAWYGAFLGFAVLVFVVPLLGLHDRLVGEKERLQLATDERLKRVMAEIGADVDAGDLSRADGLNKTLASLLQQREILARLPTWPWSATTLRAFVSAIMLPLALFVVQRVIGQLL